jgi:hypothetical protein
MQVRVRSIFRNSILTPKRVITALDRGLPHIVALADSQSRLIVSTTADIFPDSR